MHLHTQTHIVAQKNTFHMSIHTHIHIYDLLNSKSFILFPGKQRPFKPDRLPTCNISIIRVQMCTCTFLVEPLAPTCMYTSTSMHTHTFLRIHFYA